MLHKFLKAYDKISNRTLWFIIIFCFLVWIFIYLDNFYFPKLAEERRLLNEQLSNSWAKNIELIKVSTFNNEDEILNNLSSEERINQIRERLDYYKIIDLWVDKFYFSLIDNKLSLSLNSKLVWVFDAFREDDLNIFRVYWTENEFFFNFWNNKYIYNKNTDLIENIDLHIDVLYVKKSENIFIFVTSVWSYTYDLRTKNLEYFTFFQDFIYYNDSYIWIISKDDNRRINNLWLNNLLKNSIYFYNPNTKERKSLYETDLNLEKIYHFNNEIYFIDSKSDIYRLENL